MFMDWKPQHSKDVNYLKINMLSLYPVPQTRKDMFHSFYFSICFIIPFSDFFSSPMAEGWYCKQCKRVSILKMICGTIHSYSILFTVYNGHMYLLVKPQKGNTWNWMLYPLSFLHLSPFSSYNFQRLHPKLCCSEP